MTYRGATAFVVIENAKSRSWAGCIAAITKPRAAAMETPAHMANPALDQWAYTGSLSKLYECHSASVRSEGGPVTDIAGASLRAACARGCRK
eukprot:Transcript_10423.p4 GENE.Transcript_10423~~Transcript_10423.p4  ORF type:complete len:92 (+),score=7.48 Transcript_10423:566-841(+)